MSLQSYIQGKRYGKEAYQLEKEALRDPFLQDAIDGYDQVNDRHAYHLKRLEKRLSKRTRKRSHSLRMWGIAAGILLIIAMTVFFFMSSRINIFGNKTFLETHEDDVISNYVKEKDKAQHAVIRLPAITQLPDSAPALKKSKIRDKYDDEESAAEVAAKLRDLPVKTNRQAVQPIQQDEIAEADETQKIVQKEASSLKGSTGSALSNKTVQATVSSPNNSEERNQTTSALDKPKPVKGDKAYNDYIVQNRKQLVAANCENQHGKVILMFRVDKQGRPVDIAILRSLCAAADQEAIRLLQNGPNWTSGDSLARLEIDF